MLTRRRTRIRNKPGKKKGRVKFGDEYEGGDRDDERALTMNKLQKNKIKRKQKKSEFYIIIIIARTINTMMVIIINDNNDDDEGKDDDENYEGRRR